MATKITLYACRRQLLFSITLYPLGKEALASEQVVDRIYRSARATVARRTFLPLLFFFVFVFVSFYVTRKNKYQANSSTTICLSICYTDMFALRPSPPPNRIYVLLFLVKIPYFRALMTVRS